MVGVNGGPLLITVLRAPELLIEERTGDLPTLIVAF